MKRIMKSGIGVLLVLCMLIVSVMPINATVSGNNLLEDNQSKPQIEEEETSTIEEEETSTIEEEETTTSEEDETSTSEEEETSTLEEQDKSKLIKENKTVSGNETEKSATITHGESVWDDNDNREGRWAVRTTNYKKIGLVHDLVKDGEIISSTWWAVTVGNQNIDLRDEIIESGTYSLVCYILEDGIYEANNQNDIREHGEVYTSDEFVYTKPMPKLADPTNIRVEDGIVSWDPVEELSSGGVLYHCYVYKNDNLVTGRSYVCDTFSSDVLGDLTEEGIYTIKVKAISNNISNCRISEWSEPFEYDTNKIADEVNDKLDEIVEGITADSSDSDKEAAVEAIKDNYGDEAINDLALSMQTNPETLTTIKELEAMYADTSNKEDYIDLGADTSIKDISKIEVVGMRLNDKNASLSIEKPDANDEKELPASKYKNAMQFSIKAKQEDDTVISKLAIPITITMPVPDSIDINKLVILHYLSNGENEEVKLYIDLDNRTVTFTVTEFSEFVFAEEVEDAEVNPPTDGGSSSSSVSSSKGSSKGWTPVTKEDIYRFSLKEQTEPIYKTTTNAYPVEVKNEVQGKLCVAVMEAFKGSDYTLGRTYNIKPNNEKEYSMDGFAEIELTIPTTLQKENRTFQMICVSENGAPFILEDIDSNPNTITFRTDKFYAFGLAYKD